jgi:hypothetical protein
VRRLPSLLLSLTFLPALVVAGPVVSAPAATPRPVPVQVQSIDLVPSVATSSAGADGARTVADTGERATGHFEALGVTWAPDPEVGPVVVTARTRTHGSWTDWIELDQEVRTGPGETHDSGPGVRAGTEPAWVDDSDGVQVVVRVESGRAPTDVRLDLIDPGTSEADAGARLPLGSSVAQAAADRPVIRSRAEWGADESIRRAAPSYSSTIEAVAVHHTASSNTYGPADVPGILRSFYAFHVKSRGWSDIGYNVLVDKFGTAWEGRAGGLDRAVIGSHAGGFNTDTVGISMIGTFEGARLSNEMFETVSRVAAWKLSLYARDPHSRVTLMSRGSTRYAQGTRVDLPRIFGHRDVSQTACPGSTGYAALPGVRDRTAQLVPPGPPPSPFGAVEVAKDERPGLRVGGWATDPDVAGPSEVEVVVDGRGRGRHLAADRRPDVWDAHPPYGQHHGFWILLPAEPGVHEVCVTAINRGGGGDTPLGCRAVTVPVPPAPPPTRSAELSCPLLEVPPAGFVDTVGSPHARAVDCAVWWDVATGVTPTTYVPTGSVNRAQMASFLARLVLESGGTLPDSPPDAFDDDTGAGVHAKAIDQLAAVGVLRGKAPRTYDPAGLVTRDQMATFLVAAYEYRSGEALAAGDDYFYDDDASPHQGNIQKTARAGLTGGVGAGRYGPAEVTQRGQMASFLIRVLDLLIEVGETEAHA